MTGTFDYELQTSVKLHSFYISKNFEMMRNFAIFVVFCAYFGYKYLPPRKEKNVLVLAKTQELYDQEYDEISKIKGLKAAFRVLENLDDVPEK